jgi:FkbM family methyltransferase
MSYFGNIKFYHRYYDFFPIINIFYKKEYTKLKDFVPQKGDVILDLGSGIGDFSLLSSIYVGNKGKIIAIEPNKESYSLLLKNIKLNQRHNIIPIRCAITDKNRKVKIFRGESAHRDSIFRRQNSFYKVKSKTIDSLVRQLRLEKVNLIKMDIEGAEFRAIKKAKNVLEKFKPRLIIEVHEDVEKTEYLKKERMLNFLRKKGYKLLFEKINNKCPYIAVLYLG